MDTRTDVANCGACGTTCSDGKVCVVGKCELRCPTGLGECSGGCFDLKNNPDHCGDCATTCDADKYCSEGGCQPINPCLSPRQICGTECVDTRNDPANCGACGNTCATGCVASNCL